MTNSTRESNLNFLAKTELNRLRIVAPDNEQISVMKSILIDRGTASTKLILCNELTEHEVACLTWITRGKKSKDIAKELDIRHATVRSYLTRIKQKLNSLTMAQAVYEAIRQCYIRPKSFEEAPK